VTPLRALVRKELAVLFGSPIAYGVLAAVAVLTALTFFEHLRLYNQILFLYATNTMGGFESDTIPTHVNLRDSVFNPVMEQLALLLVIPIPVLTMRVFAEERGRGTDEWLLSTGVGPGRIIAAKFAVTVAFVWAMMLAAFVYPVTAIAQGGLGLQHLLSVYLGLSLLATGIAALGLLCSALATHQVVAAAASAALAFVLYDFGWTHAFVEPGTAAALDAIALHPRFGAFAEGLVRLEDVVYFAALLATCAAGVRLAFEWRRAAGG